MACLTYFAFKKTNKQKIISLYWVGKTSRSSHYFCPVEKPNIYRNELHQWAPPRLSARGGTTTRASVWKCLGVFLVSTTITRAGTRGNVVTDCQLPVTQDSHIQQSTALATMLVGSPAGKNYKVWMSSPNPGEAVGWAYFRCLFSPNPENSGGAKQLGVLLRVDGPCRSSEEERRWDGQAERALRKTRFGGQSNWCQAQNSHRKIWLKRPADVTSFNKAGYFCLSLETYCFLVTSPLEDFASQSEQISLAIPGVIKNSTFEGWYPKKRQLSGSGVHRELRGWATRGLFIIEMQRKSSPHSRAAWAFWTLTAMRH